MEAGIMLALQSIRLPILTQVVALVSALGNYAFIWIVLAIIMLFFPGRRHIGVTIIVTVIITGIIIGFIIKPMVGRVGPYDAGIGVSAVMGVSRVGSSFPSFHAATSFACAMIIAMTYGRRFGTWAFIGAVIIAFTRPFLGVEYPTDILAGAAIGVGFGLLAAWIYNQFFHDIVLNYVGNTNRVKGGRKSISNSGTRRRIR
jgi:undecaprenyl-diphosphatase